MIDPYLITTLAGLGLAGAAIIAARSFDRQAKYARKMTALAKETANINRAIADAFADEVRRHRADNIKRAAKLSAAGKKGRAVQLQRNKDAMARTLAEVTTLRPRAEVVAGVKRKI